MLELFIDDKKYNSFINYAISTCDSLSLVFEKDEKISSEHIFQEFSFAMNAKQMKKPKPITII